MIFLQFRCLHSSILDRYTIHCYSTSSSNLLFSQAQLIILLLLLNTNIEDGNATDQYFLLLFYSCLLHHSQIRLQPIFNSYHLIHSFQFISLLNPIWMIFTLSQNFMTTSVSMSIRASLLTLLMTS